ncbi:conserved hypothetical protein, partial [Ricinus communis]
YTELLETAMQISVAMLAGFEHEADARHFWDAMRARLEKFELALHPDKTRLLEFGRNAAGRRKRHGLGRPETFTFLGFIFICGRSRRGAFQLQRKSRGDRMRAKLRQIKDDLRRRWHEPIPAQGKWLKQVVQGYFAYHAVPTNFRALSAFRHHVEVLWMRALRRRSQKDRTSWARAQCPNWARWDLCGGCPVTGIPTAIFRYPGAFVMPG